MDQDQDFDSAFEQAAQELRTEQAPPADAAAPSPDASAPAPAPNKPAPVVENPAPQPANTPEGPANSDLMARLQELERRERASASRASQTARENNQLRARIDELLNKSAPAPANAPAPAPAAADDVLGQAPELEAAVRSRIQEAVQGLAGTVDRVQRSVAPIEEERHRTAIKDTHAALDDKFGPAWRQTVNDPAYDAWVDSQPDWVRNLAQTAVTFEDSATVLGRYYATHGAPAASPAPSPSPSPAPTTSDPQARLRQAAGIPARAPARPAQGPAADDFEGNFTQAWGQLQRA